MKRFAAAGLLLLLLSSARVTATQNVTFSFSWWSGLSDTEKLSAIQATIDAYQAGYLDGLIRGSRASGGKVPKETFRQYFPFFSGTVGFYRDAVSQFYSSHPDAQRATIGQIMSCLSQMPLYTCDEIVQQASQSPPQAPH